MGQTCEACGGNDGYTHNTDTKPPRRGRSFKNSTDYHPNLTSIDSASSDRDLPPLSQSHLNTYYSGSMSDTMDTPLPASPSTATANERNIEGFKTAVLNGNDSLVMYYNDEFPELNLLSLEFENGDNCLQVAVRNGSCKLIYYLLQNGAEPNAQNQSTGDTALHTAVRTRDVKVVTLLSQQGADPMITNLNYETPISIANNNKDYDIIELLKPEIQDLMHEQLSPKTSKQVSTAVHDILGHDKDNSNQFQFGEEEILTNSKSLHGYSGSMSQSKMSKILGTEDFNSLENKLDEDEQWRLKKIQLSRKHPFSKLKRANTKKALQEIKEISDTKEALPVLEAWLQKKQPTFPHNWQRRWVIIKGGYVLWSDTLRNIKNPKDGKERKKFNNSFNLMCVKDVKPMLDDTKQRKFKMLVVLSGVDNKQREYLWKCSGRDERDFWINGIKKHISHMKSVINYLGA